MNALRCLPVGCLCLLLASCANDSSPSGSAAPPASSSGLKDQIVGKWQEGKGEEAEVMEFSKDGTMSVNMGPISMKGKYKVEADGTVVTDMENPFDPGKTKTIKLKASLTKDELTLTNEEEKDEAKKTKNLKRK